MKCNSLVVACLLFTTFLFAQPAEHVFLISLDGLRWQELYGGAMDSLIANPDLTQDQETMKARFSAPTKLEARQQLMPFFWNTLAKEGQLYGNRWEGNKMDCSNRFWFSYPGYNEILSGYSDPNITSNKKIYNKNRTVLEWLHEMPAYAGKVAAFASWDVFPYIINDKRSGIPVNAGFAKAEDEYLTYNEQLLNELQDQIPSPWTNVRLDAFTHNYMMEYVKKHRPKIVYIAYGETDDFAHNGRYEQYLKSAYQTDQWIASIWEFVQNDPMYKDKTTLIITTDHGRGTSPMTEWKSHGTTIIGSNQIWAAAIGPNVAALGEVKEEQQLYQNQIAATVAQALGLTFKGDQYEAGQPIPGMIKK